MARRIRHENDPPHRNGEERRAAVWLRELLRAEKQRLRLLGLPLSSKNMAETVEASVISLANRGDHKARLVFAVAVRRWLVLLADQVCQEEKVVASAVVGTETVRRKLQSLYAQGGTYLLLLDAPRADFLGIVQDLAAGHAARAHTLAVMARGVELLRRYPEAPTVRAAIEREGLTVEQFMEGVGSG